MNAETKGPAKEDADSIQDHRIVGVGASAGGLESLERMLKRTPANTGLSFVIVQHLSPQFRSVMDELLARYTELPVQLATNGMTVHANNVYLMPPGTTMVIRGGRLVLAQKDPRHLALPIDDFFCSLAEDAGPRAAAVVLSGTGTDGSRGIREIKRAGGLVIAESTASAKFDGMPSSARATGVVDHVCAAEEVTRWLTRGRESVEADDAPADGEARDSDAPGEAPLPQLFKLLRAGFGIDFTLYKSSTIARRLSRRVSMTNAGSLEGYIERLRRDRPELGRLCHDLLIGVTEFFRDREAFEMFEKRVVPRILSRVAPHQEIRIWIAGCATGEEAYSIAMLFHEQLTAAERPINIKILATDVHRASLEYASNGLYEAAKLDNITAERRARYFSKRPQGHRIASEIRQMIVFASHDLTKDAPFTRMHLICCRNLLIYLHPSAQVGVLSRFHFGLAPEGLLVLGPSETLGSLQAEFATIDEHWKIYRKRRDVRLIDSGYVAPSLAGGGPVAEQLAVHARQETNGQRLLATYDQLLERFMPPSLLVDEDRSLVDCFGGAERLLRIKARRPSANVLSLLDDEIRTLAAGAIQRVLNRESRVEYPGLRVRAIEPERTVTMAAESLADSRAGTTRVLLSFRPEEEPARRTPLAAPKPPPGPGDDADLEAAPRSLDLEVLNAELSYTRETLQATIEELETSNEELQATNEELIASNEELQSTNEELHSVNEELYTVNAEHQRKISELREVNSDIQHMLDGTEIGTLFLDDQLRIRKYTRRIGFVFRIMPQDVGRKIVDFSHGIQRPTLMSEIERALRTGEVVEDEVRDHEGRLFFLRILPYRPQPAQIGDGARDAQATSAESAPIEGVVITVTDISALDTVRSRAEQLSAIVEGSEDAILGKMLDGTISSWNRGAQRLYGYTVEEAVGKHVSFLAPPERKHEAGEFIERIKAGERLEHIETVRIHKSGRRLDVSLSISPIRDRERKVVGASAIGRDITQLKATQRELAEREERIRALLESTAEAIYGMDMEGICTFCNPACARLLGYSSPDALVGEQMHDLVHHSTRDGQAIPLDSCRIHRSFLGGKGVHGDDEVFHRADGSCFPVEYWSYPVRRDGKVVGAVVTFLDISERRLAEEQVRLSAERREQFLAMLSHELRNPLSAVLNATRLLHTGGVGTEIARQATGVIHRQSRHMARLLDDLLDVARITSGKFELRKHSLDLRDAVRVAVETVAPLFESRGVALEVRQAKSQLVMEGDAARLQQVVANLLSNAAIYSPSGQRVEVGTQVVDGMAEVRVRDHGLGIEPDMLTKIFELFVQDEQRLDRPNGGLGVGLTLARRIVEEHEGTIEVRSNGRDCGSEFRVRLPLKAAAVVRTRDSGVRLGRGRRIVLVEDQADSRQMLRLVLQARGHAVTEAADGKSGIAAIERERPEVALVDIGLPEMSGYDVARAIRGNPALAGVRLIALTGYGTQSDVQAAREAGFDDHITKPAHAEKIDQALQVPQQAAE